MSTQDAPSGETETKKSGPPIYRVDLIRPVVTWSLNRPGEYQFLFIQYASKLVYTEDQIHKNLSEEAWYPPIAKMHWVPGSDWSQLHAMANVVIVVRSYEVRRVSTGKWLRDSQMLMWPQLPADELATSRLTPEVLEKIQQQSAATGLPPVSLEKLARSVQDTDAWATILGG